MRHGIPPITNSALARFATVALLASTLSVLSASNAAAAPITVVTTPFSGITTDLTNVGNPTLPFTDASGRILNGTTDAGSPFILQGFGWLVNGHFSFTFANLNPLTTSIGFSYGSFAGAPNMFITSASFSNGDIFTGPLSVPINTFFGFVSTTPFTSVTIQGNATSSSLRDFRTAPAPTSVPEPSSLALIGLGAGVVLNRLRSKRSKSR